MALMLGLWAAWREVPLIMAKQQNHPSLSTSPRVSPGAVVNSSLSSFTIQGLKPSTLYKVHIMASTAGGSINGTTLTLVTTMLGEAILVWMGPCGRGATTVPTSARDTSTLLALSPACFPDDTEIQFLFLTLGLVFVLLIILLICFQKNGR